jgi:hypothetical protein
MTYPKMKPCPNCGNKLQAICLHNVRALAAKEPGTLKSGEL